MFRPRNPEASRRRRAVILMVVLVLLTLFAIVGLAFVLYANAEADASRVYRESVSLQDNRIDIDPNVLANYSLQQLIFDIPDPVITATNPTPTAVNSAMRGYGLNRNIYGWNSDYLTSPTTNTPSIYPFNGVGRMHTTNGNPFGVDDHALLSYIPYPGDGFVRDPERLGMRQAAAGQNPLTAALAPYTGGWNPSYTYPDGNHVYLAAADADGNILARSFWRPYLIPMCQVNGALGFNKPYLPLDPSDPNYWSWFTDTNPNPPGENVSGLHLRYYSLRPRNADMAAGFPPPGVGGDVRNLPPSGNGFNPNDAIWMDLDYPVVQAQDGTYFKPLFAFTILDLEGRINVNTAGNVRSLTTTHLSNQGWGPWEVNPAWLSGKTNDWPQLLVGNGTVNGRYGTDKQPSTSGNFSPSGVAPRDYGQVDYDGSDDTGANSIGGNATAKITYPGAAGTFSSFPLFPPGYDNGFQPERTNHPGIYDAQYPGGDDRRFNANQHLLQMYNGGPSSTSALGTDIGKLLPLALQPSAPGQGKTGYRVRNMLTTDSVGLDTAGMFPWTWDRTTNNTTNAYGYGTQLNTNLGTNAHQPPNGNFPTFPAVALRAGAPPAGPANTTEYPPGSGFTIDWKAADGTLSKVDLNRFMPPYPHMGQGFTAATYSSTPLVNPYDRFDSNVANSALIQQQYAAAQLARQQLANAIYRRLLRVTNVTQPANPAAPTSAELAPRRWLAQLAANIVDFIDEDEISTPFNFYNTTDGLPAANIGDLNTNTNTNNPDPELPKYWVFGTELPKVVINEVLAEYVTPTDANNKPDTTKQFPVRVFAELLNTMPSATQLGGNYPNTVQPQDNPASPIPLYIPASGANPGYSPYNVVLADVAARIAGVTNSAGLLPDPSPAPNDNDNVLGTPNNARAPAVNAEFGTAANIQTIDGKAASASIAPQQFFLLSPGGQDVNGTFATAPAAAGKGNGVVPAGTPVLTSPNMQYQVQYKTATAWQLPGNNTTITDGPNPATTAGATAVGISVLLRRLANPHLPPNNQPLVNGAVNPAYNPYVTVDYMQRIMPQEGNNTYNTTVVETSTAKSQPYAANRQTYLVQNQAGTVKAPGTVDTFGTYNNATGGYNWLVHLDRQLISPMELLNVSGFHPHELTNRFMAPNGGGGAGAPIVPYNHRVNWYNEATRLFRIFEFLTTRDRASGVSALGGRQPGKVNINTVWNQEVLEALADPQAGNGFTQAQVDAVFAQLKQLRSPGTVQANQPPQITGKDRPFLSFGTGVMPSNTGDPVAVNDDGTQRTNAANAPVNVGIEDTLFRSFNGQSGTQRLFDVSTQTHPYAVNELLTKISGNLTTRSNTFAVWVTVGFFRVPTVNGQPIHVDNQATGPVKLAEEIGYSTGTNLRHRLFVVVDRTRLTIGRKNQTTLLTAPTPVALPGANASIVNQPVWVALTAASGTTGSNKIPWTVAVGSTLILDNGTANEETVEVVNPPAGQVPPANPPGAAWICVTCIKQHAAGSTVTIPGNPGPQTTWTLNSKGYPGLVLAYTIMQ
jgi:hypothetical protein